MSRAKTIEDVDDKLAETLFGEEFSAMAAEVASSAAAFMPANDDLELVAEAEPEIEEMAVAAGTEGTPAPVTEPPAALDNSASQRLATVRALNCTQTPTGAPATPESADHPSGRRSATPLPRCARAGPRVPRPWRFRTR